MNFALLNLSVAVLCAAASGLASAGATSSSLVDNVRFTVTDLTPHDGIPPGYAFIGTNSEAVPRSSGFVELEEWGPGAQHAVDAWMAQGWMAPSSVSLTSPYNQAWSRLDDAILSAGGASHGVNGTESRFMASAGTATGEGPWTAYSERHMSTLWIVPNTSLTVTVRARLFVDVSDGDTSDEDFRCWIFNGACATEESHAAASLSLYYLAAPNANPVGSQATRIVDAAAGVRWIREQDPVSGTLANWTSEYWNSGPLMVEEDVTATIVNDSHVGRWVHLSIAAAAFGRGTTPITAIPEPSTFAMMMLGGVGMAAASARARRRRITQTPG